MMRVISLGGDCQVAHQLSRLRPDAYAKHFFDWLICPIRSVERLVAQNFSNILDPTDLEADLGSAAEKPYKVVDKRYDVWFLHDFERFDEDNKIRVRAKYNYLALKFMASLREAGTMTFVRRYHAHDGLCLEKDARDLLTLMKRHNKDSSLIYLHEDVSMPTIVDGSFMSAYLPPTPGNWQGDDEAWKRIMDKFMAIPREPSDLISPVECREGVRLDHLKHVQTSHGSALAVRRDDRKLVHLSPAEASREVPIVAYQPRATTRLMFMVASDAEAFTINDLSGARSIRACITEPRSTGFSVKSPETGLFLAAEPDGTVRMNRDVASGWETFSFLSPPSEAVRIPSALDRIHVAGLTFCPNDIVSLAAFSPDESTSTALLALLPLFSRMELADVLPRLRSSPGYPAMFERLQDRLSAPLFSDFEQSTGRMTDMSGPEII